MFLHRPRGIVAAAALLAGAAIPAAHADTVTLDTHTQGWVDSKGGGNGSESFSNMYTGIDHESYINSWALFYIPPGSYSSASMTFDPKFYGDYGASTIGIFDVSHRYTTFLNSMQPGKDVYADLGSGALYGTASLLDTAKTVNLSGNAVFDINAAAGSYIVFGFSNLTLNQLPIDSTPGGIYLTGFGRGQSPLELNLVTAPVPEPGSWAMLSGGLGLIGCVARRRRSRPA